MILLDTDHFNVLQIGRGTPTKRWRVIWTLRLTSILRPLLVLPPSSVGIRRLTLVRGEPRSLEPEISSSNPRDSGA